MGKAGLLSSPARDLAQIAKRGQVVLKQNPERIDGTTLAHFNEFIDWRDLLNNRTDLALSYKTATQAPADGVIKALFFHALDGASSNPALSTTPPL
jgi:restriction endonuclease Mrr